MTPISFLKKHLSKMSEVYRAVYLTRSAQANVLTLMLVHPEYGTSCMDETDRGFSKVLRATKEHFAIPDDVWESLIQQSQANVYDYVWIADGFVPDPWPPWSEEPAQVHPLIRASKGGKASAIPAKSAARLTKKRQNNAVQPSGDSAAC